MIKRILAILFIVLVMIVFTVTCTPGKPNQQLVDDIFQAFKQKATEGVANIDMDLERIYQHVYNTKEKKLKLEQVMAPPLKWVEDQKSIDRRHGNWLTSVNQGELAKLKNDQYKVVKVEVYVENSGTPDQKFSSEIQVLDLETGTKASGDYFESALKAEQKSLELQAEQKLIAREQLALIMNGLLTEGSENWKIQRAVDYTYILRAPNLGWKDGFTIGTWTYNLNTLQLSPTDSNSAALNRLLSGLI